MRRLPRRFNVAARTDSGLKSQWAVAVGSGSVIGGTAPHQKSLYAVIIPATLALPHRALLGDQATGYDYAQTYPLTNPVSTCGVGYVNKDAYRNDSDGTNYKQWITRPSLGLLHRSTAMDTLGQMCVAHANRAFGVSIILDG